MVQNRITMFPSHPDGCTAMPAIQQLPLKFWAGGNVVVWCSDGRAMMQENRSLVLGGTHQLAVLGDAEAKDDSGAWRGGAVAGERAAQRARRRAGAVC